MYTVLHVRSDYALFNCLCIKAAFHDIDIDTTSRVADSPDRLTSLLARMSVMVSVSMSGLWNAALSQHNVGLLRRHDRA